MEILCADFLNSEFRDFRGRWVKDLLYQPEWLEEFCARWGLRVAGNPDTATLDAFAQMRSLLRAMIETVATNQPLSYEDLAALNSILVATPTVRHVVRVEQGYQLDLLPLEKNWHWVMTEIAASFAELLTEHDSRRLKICSNANCRGIFYDESKNRTRAMCSEKCSNLLKSLRFRARHADNTEPGNERS